MFSKTGLLFKNFTRQAMQARTLNQRMTSNVFAASTRGFSVKDNFLNGSNANYADHMYAQWKEDPSSVHASWHAYFTNIEGGAESTAAFDVPPTIGQSGKDAALEEILNLLKSGGANVSAGDTQDSVRASQDSAKLSVLVRAFLTHGHLVADIDPLKMKEVYKDNESLGRKFRFPKPELTSLLDYQSYGFTEQDLERTFFVDIPQVGTILKKKKQWKLKELLEAYQTAYCQKIGVEFMHISDRAKCNWIREKFEAIQYEGFDTEQKVNLYRRLNWAHSWGAFLGTKFNTMKRFGLEGCESFVPGLKVAIDALTELGGRDYVIGMPHRGRLNVLANVVRKPAEVIMAEFQGVVPQHKDEDNIGSGDVKYHLGTTFKRTYENGVEIKLSLLANPSHLEAVNPVVAGRARAEQHFLGGSKEDRKKVVPIVVHGDAAMAGQGIVFECLQMQDLQNYTVGGTFHIIVNNQVGFTTTPDRSRSGVYASDVAKAINAPIFHVNADSMEDVAKTFKIAAEYRQTFGKDVVVDLIGYRKMGHNELDQPMFTQPLMYKIIKDQQPTKEIYRQQLISEGVPEERLAAIDTEIWEALEESYKQSKTHKFEQEDWMTDEWESIKDTTRYGNINDTGVDLDALKNFGEKITVLPAESKFHPQIQKIFKARQASIEAGKSIDWGTAEALAFASLIDEGFHVRLSGQDVERGTFSHRHAHVFYQDQDGCYVPINNVIPHDSNQRNFIASNSHLSEYAVLGFEYGYAQTNPNTLCLWEAQFGDFANGAQIMIDQFVASGETKWNVRNGLVLLLPHGYDGQGPEHSSCRIERYLTLTDADDMPPAETKSNYQISEQHNMFVANCTTAAQYFHLLRRQMRRTFRKPLIVVAPKKLLKLRNANSDFEDFKTGLRFQKVIDDRSTELVADASVRKVIYCSGQVYYDLEAERTKRGIKDVAIVRVEQVSPFPFRSIQRSLNQYKNAEVTWCQEEPKNQGVWSFAEPRLRNQLKALGHKSREVTYAGREISASTATGYGKQHTQELHSFLDAAMA